MILYDRGDHRAANPNLSSHSDLSPPDGVATRCCSTTGLYVARCDPGMACSNLAVAYQGWFLRVHLTSHVVR